jgi:ribosomal-protein-alanine N-acetyltransferase
LALLDWISTDQDILLEGDGIRLRRPRFADFSDWSLLRARSRGFLQPWEPTWPIDDLSRPAYKRRMAAYQRDVETDNGYAFFIRRTTDNQMVGGITLSNIRRGVAQSASLGYWAGLPHVRQGYTLAAVTRLLKFSFQQLGLHRVEAACLPQNLPSRALLHKAGFAEEGLARSYLKINGTWSDHLLFAKIQPDT